MTKPEFLGEFDILLTKALNLAYDCGAFDDSRSSEAYRALMEKFINVQNEIRAEYERMLKV